MLKAAHQRLFYLRRLRKFGMRPSILRSFYTCTVESILTGCITTWFGNSTAGNCKALQRVMQTARHIVGGERCYCPSLQDIYTRRCIRKARGSSRTPATPPTVCSLCCQLFPSGYQANEQQKLIHPSAHAQFTICHALHFNTVQLDYTHRHTAQTQQSICYH